MVTKVAKWATLDWTYSILHWHKQYMASSLHKWGYNAFICNNQKSEYTVGSDTLWNTQELDVFCRPIIAVEKHKYCDLLHMQLII